MLINAERLRVHRQPSNGKALLHTQPGIHPMLSSLAQPSSRYDTSSPAVSPRSSSGRTSAAPGMAEA